MAAGDSRWHVVHPSAHAHEQQALDLLRAHLPDSPPFRAWSNFEFIAEDGSINEVDALIVSSDRIYLVEIKHWAGHISGNQNSWLIRSPSGRERYEENPLLLANRKARKLKSLLGRQQAFHKGQVPYIQAVVFLSEPQVELALDEIATQHVYLRPDARHRSGAHSIIDVIQGRATQAEGRPGIGRDTERALARAMDQLGLRKRTRAATVGDYLLTGLIAENDRYQDWQATHQRVASDHKRIRIFPHAQRAAEAEKRERKDIATREYALLRDIRHDAILSPRQLTESDIGPALVYDFDPDAQRLDHLIDAATAAPGFDQRLELLRAIAEALAYAHSRNVYHRALSPWTIELHRDAQGKGRPVLRDWQSGIAGQDSTADTRMTMHLGQQAGVIDNPRSAIYASPEVVAGHGYDPVAIDIFSLGALTYALFGGRHPAASVEEMLDKCRRGPGLMMSEALDGAPDSLQLLVQIATDPNPGDRHPDVREFLRMLDEVEDELTTPEPERGALPADARQGDLLTGGFKVLRRLGAGSTCHALAVENPEGQQGVLKVAKDPSFNERLRQEYDTLLDVPHPNIVKAFGIHEIDGLTAIFIEQAGHRTMGQRLREQGPLSLDLLERFGDELLAVLVHLEREGINHRDIKPENIGLGETRKRALTLKLFDFSLARAPAENIRAGTPPYLDPFLSLRQPPRWDLHAERFAAAMTLHEMATGTLPTWGAAGQDPASSDEDASLDVEKFDASIRDGLADFFRRALHRDSRKRFDNADLMHLAWKNLFRHIDQATTTDDDRDGSTTLDFSRVDNLTHATPLSELGLSARELNAADRIGATTVGQLLALPGIRFYRNRGIGQQITRRLRQVREALAAHLGQATAPDLPDDQPGTWSIDRLAKALEGTKLEAGEAEIINHWLGLADATPAATLDLPSQREVAEATGSSRAQVQAAIDRAAGKWAKNSWMTTLRDEVAAYLKRRESIASVAEVASGLLIARGSTAGEAERQRLSAAVLQAALEVEASRESARYVLYRGHAVPLLVSTEGQGGEPHASTAERTGFAEALAEEATRLAAEDPLPSPRRAEQALMAIPAPAGDPPMTPERRLRLAQAVAPGVALSSRQELYPVGLSAERALRLGANTLLGARRLGVEQLHARIHSRFSMAQRLPGRPALDRLLQQIDFPLQWYEAGDGLPAGYAMPQQASGATRHTSTLRRMTTTVHGDADSPEAQQARAFDATVRRALDTGRVLLVSADLKWVEAAAPELCQQYALTALSLDRLLIDALKAQAGRIGADWRVVRQADAAAQSSADWRRLATLVERAMPALLAQLRDDPRPLLLQHLGLMVRYGQVDLIQRLRDAAGAGQRPARLLLLPGDSHQPPVLDGVVLPVITPADWTHLPRSWLENRHRAALAATTSGTSA